MAKFVNHAFRFRPSVPFASVPAIRSSARAHVGSNFLSSLVFRPALTYKDLLRCPPFPTLSRASLLPVRKLRNPNNRDRLAKRLGLQEVAGLLSASQQLHKPGARIAAIASRNSTSVTFSFLPRASVKKGSFLGMKLSRCRLFGVLIR